MPKEILKPTILIIGGMGPWASLDLHKKILQEYSAKDADNDSYPKIMHISVNIPDFIDKEKSVAEQILLVLKDQLADFQNVKFDIGLIACNTMHIFYNEINQIFDKKLTNIVDLTKKQIKKGETVGLLGTPFTIRNNLYLDKSYSLLTPENEQDVQSIIDHMIAGQRNDSYSKLIRQIGEFKKRGAEKVIFGCTELSILNDKHLQQKLYKLGYPDDYIIDPMALFIDNFVKTR